MSYKVTVGNAHGTQLVGIRLVAHAMCIRQEIVVTPGGEL